MVPYNFRILIDCNRIENGLVGIARALDGSRREAVSRNATTLRYKRSFVKISLSHTNCLHSRSDTHRSVLRNVCPIIGELFFFIYNHKSSSYITTLQNILHSKSVTFVKMCLWTIHQKVIFLQKVYNLI